MCSEKEEKDKSVEERMEEIPNPDYYYKDSSVLDSENAVDNILNN